MRNTPVSSTIRNGILSALCILSFSEPVFPDDSIHFHGYGELHYNNTNKKNSVDTMDNHRLVLGWTYRYNDRIRLDVEVDYEHAAQEMELEFAYIDFLISDSFNIRAGSMLMPVGYLNEFHEPPLFYSVERPYVQKNVIPTTWQEGGAGIFGSLNHGLHYRFYIVNGLDAKKFTAGSGIRNGRHKGGDAPSDDLAVVGRLEYFDIKNFKLGVSGYRGNAGQGTAGLGDTAVSLVEADARYWVQGIELTGLYSRISIANTEKLYAVTNQAVGKNISGYYLEAAYHVGRLFLPSEMDIVLFVRNERFDTQNSLAAGFTADPKNDFRVTTFGISYFPINKVALKIDMENWRNGKDETWEQFNAGIAYMY